MKRTIRRILEIALPVAGMGIIFLAVLFGSDSLQLQVLLVLLGILILEAGVWGLASRILPDERRFLRLREEGEHFVTLIRELNAAAVAKKEGDGSAEYEKRFRDALEQMHASVRRMGEVAASDKNDEAKASDTDARGGEADVGLDTAKQLP